ncbi:MAG: L-threonylcarbamoyladenylate synthase [Elainella sp.]
MAEVSLAEFIAAARAGTQLVSFPTDTVPALACRPDAAALIYAAKQRSETKPLILMGSAAADLWPYVMGSEAELAAWQQVAERYWPGALTLVLPASPQLPQAMNPTDPTTIGLRVPDHTVARQILAQTGPLATTSVNRSGEPALLSLAEVNAQFPEALTLGSDAMHSLDPDSDLLAVPASGQPSTVAKWSGQGWQILRQGEVRLPEA